jgi:hypothetical protein
MDDGCQYKVNEPMIANKAKELSFDQLTKHIVYEAMARLPYFASVVGRGPIPGRFHCV